MNKQEIKKQLDNAYPYRLELHAHTSPASHCSQVKPEDAVKAFAEAGYHGIAVTNHFYYEDDREKDFIDIYRRDYYKALETGEKLGIKVYLGAELRFTYQNDNDYLLFGFKPEQLEEIYTYTKEDGTLEKFSENFRTDGMFLLQAHPFRDDMEKGFEKHLDGVEIFNMHPGHNSRVAVASRHALEHGKIGTAGTDFHHITHCNLCATRAPYLPQNEAELVQLLKSGDFIFEVADKIII